MKKTDKIGYPALKIEKSGNGCTFNLMDGGEFAINMSISPETDVIYDTLNACLSWLTTGCGAVRYYDAIDDTMSIALVMTDNVFMCWQYGYYEELTVYENVSAKDFCRNILLYFGKYKDDWIKFSAKKEKGKTREEIITLSNKAVAKYNAKFCSEKK